VNSWKKSLAKVLAVLLSAFLLSCAFPLPPFLKSMEGASAAWLALIPLIIVIRLSRAKAAFWWGWLCGLLFWLVSLAWVLQLRNSWGGSPLMVLPLVILAWVAMAAYCALYMGVFAFLLAKIFPGSPAVVQDGVPTPCEVGVSSHCGARMLGNSVVHRIIPLLLAPVIWVGCEYLRAVLLTGFPWNILGVSQYRNIVAIQIASWGGTYAVSGLIVLLNAALALTALRIVHEVRHRIKGRRIHYELMVGLTAIAICWSTGISLVKRGDTSRYKDSTIRIAAVQPNILQPQKWSEKFRLNSYYALQEQTKLAVMSQPDLVIWPETAIPDLLRVDPLAQKIVSVLVSNKTSLLVGSMDYEQPNEDILYYNASFLVDESGDIAGTYRKRHLVPFGEYLPFENQIPLIKKMAPLGFSCQPGGESGLMELGLGDSVARFGVLICFEDVFPYLARRDVRKGARFLVNQTNDAWFEPSAASEQHMANAVFRAVENRVPLVRCANTGVTCFIDRFGRIAELLESDSGRRDFRGFSVSEIRVPPENMSLTPYTRFGDWILAIPCAMVVIGLLGWLFVLNRRKRR